MKTWIPIVSALIVLTIGLFIGTNKVAKSSTQYGENALMLKEAGEILAEDLEKSNEYLDRIIKKGRTDDYTKLELVRESKEIGNRLSFIREECLNMGFKNPRNMQWKIPAEVAYMIEKSDLREGIEPRELRALKSIQQFYSRLHSRIAKLNGESQWGILTRNATKNSDWIEFYIGISGDIYESDVQRYFPYYN